MQTEHWTDASRCLSGMSQTKTSDYAPKRQLSQTGALLSIRLAD